GLVELLDRREPARADDQFAVARRPAADHARVPSLRDDVRARGGALAEHGRDLVGARGADDQEGAAREPTRQVVLVARLQPGVGQDVLVADDGGKTMLEPAQLTE